MIDYGIGERWPARHCARKWADLESANATAVVTSAGMTPVSISQFSSPIEGPVHFAFMGTLPSQAQQPPPPPSAPHQ